MMTIAELRRLLAEAQEEAVQAQVERNPALLYEGPTEARWALWRAAAPALPVLLDVAEAAQLVKWVHQPEELDRALVALENSTNG